MDAVVKKLLREAGRTYAEEAQIPLKDQPAPLFKLLVLSNLLSARISAEIAVSAARELFEAGGGTARGLLRMTWQDRVDALGRGHYVRYDESTATRLGDTAEIAQDKYGGDLRRLARDSGRDPQRAAELLREFPGIGPTGVDIFFREAQAVWPWLRPYMDEQARKGAERLGLPTDPKRLADLVPDKDLARFAAALVRVAKDKKLAESLTAGRKVVAGGR
ncbi:MULTISPECIES: endonuclease [Thermomonospora]|uniref:Endonuclease III n=1 Tax=Thermomonospora cellulosilytica TaxID=1411118 RepID=A0A7W3MYQ3_9ACTN|nr:MULTISPECIES: endonuclease [Thermomonospora]MBA9004359.1 endonuclease III [Thermomonospora cellulosilytica]